MSKRDRLIDLVSQKKLIASKYRELNKATLSKTSKYLSLTQLIPQDCNKG